MWNRMTLTLGLWLAFAGYAAGQTSPAESGARPAAACPLEAICSLDNLGNNLLNDPIGSSTNRSFLWNAGMEQGNLDEWHAPGPLGGAGGGKYDDAGGASVATREQARSGSWSAKMVIWGTGATRLFRWEEHERNAELYYSVWFFIPQRYTVNHAAGSWANWWQWKSLVRATRTNDPFFILDVNNRGGEMYVMLTWWPGLDIEGPAPGQAGGRRWHSHIDLPVKRWFQVEARYKCAGDFTGAVQFWQDGTEIFSLDGVKTRYASGDCQWSLNNYGARISPSPVVIYIDDAVISTSRVGAGP